MPEFISLLPVWQLWLVAALILFALEVITPGFILACFGVGALLAIIPALFGGSWLIQAIFFGVGSLLALWLLKPLMARWFAARDTKTGMDALIGRKAFVSEAIKVGDGGGRIAVDGDSWRAISSVAHDLPPQGAKSVSLAIPASSFRSSLFNNHLHSLLYHAY